MSGRVYSYVRNERQPRSGGWGGGGGSSSTSFQGSSWPSQSKQYGSGSYSNSSYGGGRRDPISRSEGLGRSQISRAPRAPPPGDIRTSRMPVRPNPRSLVRRSAPHSTNYMQPERESRYSGSSYQAPSRRLPRIAPRRVPQRSSPQPRRPMRPKPDRPRKRFLSEHTFSRSKRRRVSSGSRITKMSKPRKERNVTRLTPASLILASGIPGEAKEHKFLSVKFQGHPFLRPRALVSEESGMITFEIVEVTKKSRRRLTQRCEFSILKRDVLSLIAFEGDKIPEVLVRKRKENDIDLAKSDDGRRKVKVEKNTEEDEEEMEEVMEENLEPEHMTSDQLRRELQNRGLENRGLKAELIQRLKDALAEENGKTGKSGDIVLQTVNSSALFVHVDSEDEAPEDETDQRGNRLNYGDDEEEEPVYDEDQQGGEREDRRHQEDSRSEKEDIFESNEDYHNEDREQDQRDNEHSEEEYIYEPAKEYSDEDRNQYNAKDGHREESEEHDEEEVEGGRGGGEIEEDVLPVLNNKEKESGESAEAEDDSPWDKEEEPTIRQKSPSKNEKKKEASPKKVTKNDRLIEKQSLGVDEHEFQAREPSDNGEQSQNDDQREASEEEADENEANTGVYKEDVGLKNGKSMVQQLMEMNKNSGEQQKEGTDKTGDGEHTGKEVEKKSSMEVENAEAPPAEPETFETTSYRVIIVTKRGARIIRRADSLLSRDKLERSRIIILEFALTSQNSTPKKAFTTLMDGPYEDIVNSDVWPEKGPLSFKHTLTNILSDMLAARAKEKRVSNAEGIFEENQELKRKNRSYEAKFEDLTSEMERLKKKILRAKETLG